MIRKFLSFLFCLISVSAFAQKPDFIRTPNGPNTIVDWNLKAKTLIVPHGTTLTLSGAQDTTGHIRLITAAGDTSLYFYVHGKGWIKTINSNNESFQKSFTNVSGYTINWQTDIPDGAVQTYAQLFGNTVKAFVFFTGSSPSLPIGQPYTYTTSSGNVNVVTFDWGSSQSGFISFNK